MSLKLIVGKTKTGKTEYCFNQIKEKINLDSKIFIIVPEQSSYAAEKRLLRVLDNQSTLNAEVITFNRMAYRISTEVEGAKNIQLSQAGKAMIMRYVLEKQKDKVHYLNKSKENIDLVIKIIAELKKHNLSVDNIDELIKEVENRKLKTKLEDINIIYRGYEEVIKNNYIDDNDVLTFLGKRIEKSKMFANSYVFIDDFSGFTKQEYIIIKKLMRMAKEVNVAICADSLEEKEPEVDIFFQNKKIANKLIEYAKELKITIEEVKLHTARGFENSEMEFLEKNIYENTYKQYNKNVEHITLFLAVNPYSEVEHIAKTINKIVRNNEVKYKDISIIVQNIDTYSSIIRVVFKKYNIPVFIDEKSELSQSVLIKYVLALLDIFAKNWSNETIFTYLKTGLLDIKNNDIYFLENYCKKWGINRNKWYGEDWNFDESSVNVNEIRKNIVKPLIEFEENLKGTKTVEQITKELYRFIDNNKIFEKLENKAKMQEEVGNIEVANNYIYSWNILMDIFDEITEIFRDEKMTFEKYREILREGLNFSSLGKIPSTMDEVTVGDIARSRTSNTKIAFILGINDGVIPEFKQQEGFLSDNDRNTMKNLGFEIAKGTMENLYESQFNIYKTLTAPSQNLFLSYLSSSKEGKALRPSTVLYKIKKIFPELKEEDDVIWQKTEITTEEATFEELLINLEKLTHGEKIDDIWFDVFNWYKKNLLYKDKLEMALEALKYTNKPSNISEENIQKLYGKTFKTSISKLEQYRRCPFSFHLKYGLKIKETEEFRIKPINTGSFMHEVIDEFFEKNKEIGIKNIQTNEISNIVNCIINQKLGLKKNYIFTSSARFRALTNKLKKVTIQSIEYIVYQIKNSDFEPISNELTFKKKIGNIELEGKIDRIDIGKFDGKNYINIIDYKSSTKSVDLNELLFGTQIQLWAYMDVAQEKFKAEAAGVLYFNLIDALLETKEDLSEEEIREKLRKEFKMQGIILADVKIIRMMDKNFENGTSSVVPATINNAGEISHSKSNTITKEDFTNLQKAINNIIIQIAKEIQSGKIDIKPAYKDKSSCEYCEYKTICQFNPKINSYAYINKLKKEEILKNVKE